MLLDYFARCTEPVALFATGMWMWQRNPLGCGPVKVGEGDWLPWAAPHHAAMRCEQRQGAPPIMPHPAPPTPLPTPAPSAPAGGALHAGEAGSGAHADGGLRVCRGAGRPVGPRRGAGRRAARLLSNLCALQGGPGRWHSAGCVARTSHHTSRQLAALQSFSIYRLALAGRPHLATPATSLRDRAAALQTYDVGEAEAVSNVVLGNLLVLPTTIAWLSFMDAVGLFDYTVPAPKAGGKAL